MNRALLIQLSSVVPGQLHAQPRPPLADRVLGSPNGSAAGKLRKADEAYVDLKHLMLTLQLPPGCPLDERTLMEQRGHGRTPLREAIQRLTHDQLVVTLPRRGSWVSELSYEDLMDMVEARTLLEPMSAERAASRITPVELDELQAMVERGHAHADAGDLASMVYVDFQFHNLAAGAARNRYLAQAIEQTNLAMLRYWFISFKISRLTARSRGFIVHQSIVDALAAADPAAARAAMSEHIYGFQARMRDLFTGALEIGGEPSDDVAR